ncbi:spermatogenesis-associated 4-like isoform X2 [Brachionus plicatilis]|uniref:Spermatogenesis-associated protein 4 n=1 Tax=Brachionus plicatilis TaxID=10195 RepID=A0A3M7QI75_BRAPC|nr:spermatogenesis-associated 4-like isoform X2 [Brachionus plicatilis]
MSGLSRSVVKWIQSLDLTFQIKNPKWDLTNGFLVAEIFSWYYPDEIKMFTFNNGKSLDSKLSNWSLIKKFITKNEMDISNELIDGTIHCKEGAAVLLLENLYQFLTNRPIQKAQLEYEIDLTDKGYQMRLPYHARSTAAKSIKTNIKNTELLTDPNLKLSAQKVEILISNHVENRKSDRENEPQRFDVKKTIAEKCVQKPVPETRRSSEVSNFNTELFLPESEQDQDQDQAGSQSNEMQSSKTLFVDSKKSSLDKNFKEIRVRQDAYEISFATVN